MAYVCYTDVQGKIPPKFLIQALDDDLDGQPDPGLFDLIASQVSTDIDGRLGQRYAVPFSAPLPAIVSSAALIFACEAVYARRVTPEQNPWMGQGNSFRSKLDRIGQGLEPLTPELQRKAPSVSVIGECSKTFSRRSSV
jgi:hypothetical protein